MRNFWCAQEWAQIGIYWMLCGSSCNVRGVSLTPFVDHTYWLFGVLPLIVGGSRSIMGQWWKSVCIACQTAPIEDTYVGRFFWGQEVFPLMDWLIFVGLGIVCLFFYILLLGVLMLYIFNSTSSSTYTFPLVEVLLWYIY